MIEGDGRAAHVLAGLGGGFACLAFYLGLDLVPSLSILAGVAGYGGLRLVFRALGRGPGTGRPAGASPVDDLIVAARVRLMRLDALSRDTDPAMARRLGRLIRAGAGVLDHVARHPGDAMRLRRLLTFYLETSVRIVESYEPIRRRRGADHPSLAKVGAMLDEVEAAFARHADQTEAAEIGALETELAVLERSLKAERG